jgi:glutathione S-transferase
VRRATTSAIISPLYARWCGRDGLADRLSYADLGAAAHLSTADDLGDVRWSEDQAAKHWTARVKSRLPLHPLLAATVAGIAPSRTSADLDF